MHLQPCEGNHRNDHAHRGQHRARGTPVPNVSCKNTQRVQHPCNVQREKQDSYRTFHLSAWAKQFVNALKSLKVPDSVASKHLGESVKQILCAVLSTSSRSEQNVQSGILQNLAIVEKDLLIKKELCLSVSFIITATQCSVL